ncbi:MAG: DUF362 domain-containing protein, partial [Cyanobacteriota bacterium]|nr:DUF362 domain-containing protein [Cyanobacteriota bacterium]
MRANPVEVATTEGFVYRPPETAQKAKRILIKPNLGYPVGHPVTVSKRVLTRVIEGLKHANPTAEILVVEGVCSPVSLREIVERNGLSDLFLDGVQ